MTLDFWLRVGTVALVWLLVMVAIYREQIAAWWHDLLDARAYPARHSLDTAGLDDPWLFVAPADTWLSHREVTA